MYIKVKRTPCAHVEGASAQDDEYERIDAKSLFNRLALHDEGTITDDGLFALYRHLASSRAPEGSLGLSELDGLLTAVMASPEGVSVLEWMPLLWGSSEPAFEDMAEAEVVLAAVADRCRDIETQLYVTGQLICILERSSRGEVAAGAWCRGFVRGIMLSPKQWQPVFDHELSREFLCPITTVAANERAWDLFFAVKDKKPWSRTPDLTIADCHPFLVSELPHIKGELGAGARGSKG